LLHASFRPRLTATPLRFANPSPPSGWVEDFHLQVENAQAIEHHLGPKTKLVHSHTKHEGYDTQGTSERSGPLMTFHQIRKLEDDEIIAFHRNLSPIKAKRMDWRHFPELVARTKIPPPPLVRRKNIKTPEAPVSPSLALRPPSGLTPLHLRPSRCSYNNPRAGDFPLDSHSLIGIP